jgi:predicted short-subunit dehydrogenase-like oxidoreductase (DUF2520 family)
VSGDAIHPHLTFGRTELAIDQLQDGGLAGTAGTDKKRQLTRLQCQVDVVERKP